MWSLQSCAEFIQKTEEWLQWRWCAAFCSGKDVNSLVTFYFTCIFLAVCIHRTFTLLSLTPSCQNFSLIAASSFQCRLEIIILIEGSGMEIYEISPPFFVPCWECRNIQKSNCMILSSKFLHYKWSHLKFPHPWKMLLHFFFLPRYSPWISCLRAQKWGIEKETITQL